MGAFLVHMMIFTMSDSDSDDSLLNHSVFKKTRTDTKKEQKHEKILANAKKLADRSLKAALDKEQYEKDEEQISDEELARRVEEQRAKSFSVSSRSKMDELEGMEIDPSGALEKTRRIEMASLMHTDADPRLGMRDLIEFKKNNMLFFESKGDAIKAIASFEDCKKLKEKLQLAIEQGLLEDMLASENFPKIVQSLSTSASEGFINWLVTLAVSEQVNESEKMNDMSCLSRIAVTSLLGLISHGLVDPDILSQSLLPFWNCWAVKTTPEPTTTSKNLGGLLNLIKIATPCIAKGSERSNLEHLPFVLVLLADLEAVESVDSVVNDYVSACLTSRSKVEGAEYGKWCEKIASETLSLFPQQMVDLCPEREDADDWRGWFCRSRIVLGLRESGEARHLRAAIASAAVRTIFSETDFDTEAKKVAAECKIDESNLLEAYLPLCQSIACLRAIAATEDLSDESFRHLSAFYCVSYVIAASVPYFTAEQSPLRGKPDESARFLTLKSLFEDVLHRISKRASPMTTIAHLRRLDHLVGFTHTTIHVDTEKVEVWAGQAEKKQTTMQDHFVVKEHASVSAS